MTNAKKTHLPCPNPACTSSDAYSIQDNGWGKCFVCGVNVPPDGEVPEPAPTKPKLFSALPQTFQPIPERGFTEESCRRYKVGMADGAIRYPLVDVNDHHIGNKIRLPEKRFLIEGDFKEPGLFGRHAFPAGGSKAITVTEGQDDAIAAYQLMGSKYPAVSVHSASTAEKDVLRDFEYLNSFETIVFAFDADEAGRKAAKACAGLGFPIGKVKVLNLRKGKDANDYLYAKDSEGFTREWWQAEPYKPDGLLIGSDARIWEAINERKDSFCVDYPFAGLNALCFGIRLSELVVVTADTGVGKTSVLKHIEHFLLTNETVKELGYGVGFLHLEEPNGDTALGLLSVHNSVPYHLPTSERPPADLRRAYDDLLNNDRVVIWDHFGSNSVDAVIDKVRHMAALGCKYIVIDHLSIIVSDQSGDERKQLDEISTKLKTITMELDLAVIAVIHTNRAGQIRGTAGVEQLANIVLRLERDKIDTDEWRRNITKVTVEKNRFSGYTGPASYLWYNKETGRLSELSEDEVHTFIEGGTLREDQRW